MTQFYVEASLQEWGMREQPRRLEQSVRKVLSELTPEALLRLKDKRLEVRVLPEFACESNGVWAYFPIWPRWTRAAWELTAQGITYGQFANSVFGNIRDADLLGRRLVVMQVLPRIETRVLLVFSMRALKAESARDFEGTLQDRLGHVLLYLRSPRAWNDCEAARKEWRASVLKPQETRKTAQRNRRQKNGCRIAQRELHAQG